MPLIDLKTNLKNIKYSKDRLNGGYSNQPYIRTRIPGVLNSGANVDPIFILGADSYLDYPIRGGALTFDVGNSTYTLSNQIDKSRIKKFFEDKPRGSAFIQKQIGLQLSNPKIETGNTLFGLGQGTPLPGLLENTRVYNKGINTLAQVGVQGTGAHAIRHGMMPFNPWQKNYYAIVNQQNVMNFSENNRLLILTKLKMTSRGDTITSVQNVSNINTVNSLGISLNKNILFQYLGGPGSVYGIGNTTINRVVDTTTLKSRNAMVYDELMAQKSNFGNSNPKLVDFRNTTVVDGWTNSPLQIDNRFYTATGKYKDKLNQLYPIIFNSNDNPWDKEKDSDDLIKFAFEAVSNDNPDVSTALFFRAFLTSGITDNNSSGLNSFKYMGRGEDFFTYQGFSRTISFAFRVVAGSKEELRPMYNRLNNLLSQVYPDYSDSGIMRAPLVKLTIGDYIFRTPGFLENVNFTIENNYPWELNFGDDVAQLPKVIDVNVTFKPIMNILPRRSNILGVDMKTGMAEEYDPSGLENTQTQVDVNSLIANNNNFVDVRNNVNTLPTFLRSRFGSGEDRIQANNDLINRALEQQKESLRISSRIKAASLDLNKNASKSDSEITSQFLERQNFEKNVPNFLTNKGLI